MRLLVVAGMLVGCGFNQSVTPGTDAGMPITVGFERASSVEDEASGTVMIPVRLDASSDLPVMVNYKITDGSATRGLDYAATNGTLQFFAGETTKYIAVEILADGLEEGDETFRVHLQDAIGAKLATADHVVTINSHILPRVYFTLLASKSLESQAQVQLNLALDVASPVDVTVGYTLSGTATAADYNLVAGTVTFPVGTMTRQIDLAPIDDALDEDPEDAVVTLVDPVDVIIKPNEGVRTHTLEDNDPTPTIQFTAQGSTVMENAGTVSLTLQLSAVSGRDVIVPFSGLPATTNGASAADYTYTTLSPLTIPAGTQTLPIVVTVVDDALDEFIETFSTVLGTPTNADLTGTTSYALSIDDNDQPPTVMFDPLETDGAAAEGSNGNPRALYKVTLSGASGKPISVPINFSGTAETTVTPDYSVMGVPVMFAPGDTVKTITLDIVPDIVPEPDETIIMDIPSNGALPPEVRQGSPAQRTHTIQNDD